MMNKTHLKPEEFDFYYKQYIDKLSDDLHLRDGFVKGKKEVVDFYKAIPFEKLEFKYQPEKWTVKEILQHQIDTERIFMYRCFRISRRDSTPLAGYDQDVYMEPSRANEKSLDELLNEFIMTRNNSIALLHSFRDNDLQFIGNSSGSDMSARAAAFVVIGHDIWHMEIIKERYL